MKRELKIVFMGTPDFAVPSLRILVEQGYQIVGVITAPDKPAGRGRQMQQSAVKQYALSQGLKILQPEKLKDPVFLEELRSLEANLQVVVAFRMLPEIVWAMPAYGTFNLHASLLPRYRGAAPINWAIINGETETGVTTFFLQQEIDTGDILLQEKIPISSEDDAGSLHDKLMQLGADVVLRTVQAIEQDTVKPFPQSETTEESKAPKIFKEDCLVNWNKPGIAVNNFIRGLSPYPAAFTQVQGKGIKIFRATFLPKSHSYQPGAVVTDGKTFFRFAVPDGYINCLEVQLEGKGKMPVKDFLLGYRA
jgi:methionyl-tRNA formyltransferase